MDFFLACIGFAIIMDFFLNDGDGIKGIIKTIKGK
jgi:hypothetical protein